MEKGGGHQKMFPESWVKFCQRDVGKDVTVPEAKNARKKEEDVVGGKTADQRMAQWQGNI